MSKQLRSWDPGLDVGLLMTGPMSHGVFCSKNELIPATSDCKLDPGENCKILRVQVSRHAEVSSGLRSHDWGLPGWAQGGWWWDSEDRTAVLVLHPDAGDIKRVPCTDSVSGTCVFPRFLDLSGASLTFTKRKNDRKEMQRQLTRQPRSREGTW